MIYVREYSAIIKSILLPLLFPQMSLPTGYESAKRFLEIPFSGKMEDFATWEHHFSSAAALLGFSAFMVPEGDDAAERALLDSEEKKKLDLSFFHLLVTLCRAGEASEILRNDLDGALSGRAAWLTTKATPSRELDLCSLNSSHYQFAPLLRHLLLF